MEQWNNGKMEQWNWKNRTMELRNNATGTMEPWNNGIMEQWNWNNAIMELEQWNNGIMYN